MRKCANCLVFFVPNQRNAWHQKYCTKPQCRKASQAASWKEWFAKEENRDHFRGPVNVLRVQEWRKKHPGYWQRKTPKENDALPNLLIEIQSVNQLVVDHVPESLENHLIDKTQKSQAVKPYSEVAGGNALQNFLIPQHAVLVGLIAHLTGSALQNVVVPTIRRMEELGRDILNQP
jgi:hypothetical protein